MLSGFQNKDRKYTPNLRENPFVILTASFRQFIPKSIAINLWHQQLFSVEISDLGKRLGKLVTDLCDGICNGCEPVDRDSPLSYKRAMDERARCM